MAASKEQIIACARNLKTSEAWAEIVRGIKAQIFVEWGKEPDARRREELFRELQALGRIDVALQTITDNAEMDDRKAAAAIKSAEKGT